MNDVTTRRQSDRGSEIRPWIVSGFGVLSVALFVGWCLWFRALLDPIAVAVGFVTVAVPALALVWAGRRLARSNVGATRYARIVQWCFGGAFVSLLVNVFVMVFFPWYSLAGNVAWAHFALNTGAGVGFLVGYVEARAIQREVEAAAAAVRAEQLEEDRELLTYLNDLLRHEVLNSTQIISGHASLLLEDADDDTRDRLETIDRESETLTDVIDDIRAMLNATQTSEVRAVVALDELLTDELTRLEREYDVDLEATVPDDIAAEGNEGIKWIFANVLENAVEHNDSERPRIEVTVTTTPETAIVRIADDGPGIPEDVRETLFERRSENHGLGLYLVRILATRYGGSVELTETGPDGSVVTVTLSRADGGQTDEPSDRDRDRTPLETDSSVPNGESEPAPTDETGTAGTAVDAAGKPGTDADADPESGTDPNDAAAGPT